MTVDLYGLEAVQQAATDIEIWENPYRDNDYLIQVEHPEFTALCPRSGYPDSGIILIDYVPDLLLIELKAIKLYINSFRNRHICHEAVTNEIASKLYEAALPKSMRVIGDFKRRGNVKTVITTLRGDTTYPFPKYTPSIL